MRLIYVLLSAVGLVGTWFFNRLSRTSDQGYLAGWFANDASPTAAVDLIVTAVVACLFIVIEGHRTELSQAVWFLVPLSFSVAVAWTFPLLLAWREDHLRRQQHSVATSLTSARVPA